MSAFFQKLPGAFFCPRFYANLLRHEHGTGFAYIALATLIDLFGYTFLLWKVLALLGVMLTGIANQLPEARIADHKLSIDRPSPYTIAMADPGFGGKMHEFSRIVIDTDFQFSNLTQLNAYMTNNRIILLVTADQVVVQQAHSSELKIYSFSNAEDQVITSKDWLHLNHLIDVFAPFVFAGILLATRTIANLIKNVIGGVVAVIVGSFTRTVPDFSAGMRLAAAAMIPQALVAALMPSHGAWSLLVWLGYIVFGAASARRHLTDSKAHPGLSSDPGI